MRIDDSVDGCVGVAATTELRFDADKGRDDDT